MNHCQLAQAGRGVALFRRKEFSFESRVGSRIVELEAQAGDE